MSNGLRNSQVIPGDIFLFPAPGGGLSTNMPRCVSNQLLTLDGQEEVHIGGFSQEAFARPEAELWIKQPGQEIFSFSPNLHSRAEGQFGNVSMSQVFGISNVFPTSLVGEANFFSEVDGVPQSQGIHGILWEKDRTLRLGDSSGTLFSDSRIHPHDVNDSGEIVGSALRIEGLRAVRWTVTLNSSSDQVDEIVLGALSPSGGASEATAINNRGQIVGWATSETGEPHAFLWTEDGVSGPPFNPRMRDLGKLDFASSVATDINGAGVVVGNLFTPTGDSRAFRWTSDRGIEILSRGPVGDNFGSGANSISDDGHIVGNVGITATIWASRVGTPEPELIDLNRFVRIGSEGIPLLIVANAISHDSISVVGIGIGGGGGFPFVGWLLQFSVL